MCFNPKVNFLGRIVKMLGLEQVRGNSVEHFFFFTSQVCFVLFTNFLLEINILLLEISVTQIAEFIFTS